MTIKLDLDRFVACLRSIHGHDWEIIKLDNLKVPEGDLRVKVYKCTRCGDYAINPIMEVLEK